MYTTRTHFHPCDLQQLLSWMLIIDGYEAMVRYCFHSFWGIFFSPCPLWTPLMLSACVEASSNRSRGLWSFFCSSHFCAWWNVLIPRLLCLSFCLFVIGTTTDFSPQNPKLIVFHLVGRLSLISFRAASGGVCHSIHVRVGNLRQIPANVDNDGSRISWAYMHDWGNQNDCAMFTQAKRASNPSWNFHTSHRRSRLKLKRNSLSDISR